MLYKIGLLRGFGNRLGKHLCHNFFLDGVAHHRACNFVWGGGGRLRRGCFTVGFMKMLGTFCGAPPMSASNFDSAFLALGPWGRVFTFCRHCFFRVFLGRFIFLMGVNIAYGVSEALVFPQGIRIYHVYK